jgi:hypothetical protein
MNLNVPRFWWATLSQSKHWETKYFVSEWLQMYYDDYVKYNITRTCGKCGDTRNTVQNLIWKTSNCPYTAHVTDA